MRNGAIAELGQITGPPLPNRVILPSIKIHYPTYVGSLSTESLPFRLSSEAGYPRFVSGPVPVRPELDPSQPVRGCVTADDQRTNDEAVIDFTT
ncbi:hypothetical protein RRF57_006255 [Xylaria bambusicola]|uniref:Uncharacterized protein n=1 Tax=Xylaria bambusicola TaxID=326684 RepID=A0AAN7UDZ9_9PEZI